MLLLFWKVCHDVGISTPLGIRVACGAEKKTRRLEVEFSIYFFLSFQLPRPLHLLDGLGQNSRSTQGRSINRRIFK